MRRGAENSGNGRAAEAPRPARKLAGAPISWGVCEVPGWGRQLPPERVLSEMASLGLASTELGPVGYLPTDAGRTRELLRSAGLGVVAGFLPLVLHERTLEPARRTIDEVGSLLAALGAEVLVVTPVMDAGWSPPVALDDQSWRRLTNNLAAVDDQARELGLTTVLHPHVGALLETDPHVERILADSPVAWCLDTGHLTIGGTDPAEFVRRNGARIAHVHLKDVDKGVAEQVRARDLPLVEATRRGLFRPLGQGDAEISEVVDLLDRHGYERWLVLEQDTTIAGEEPPAGRGPMLDVRTSIEYLASLAPANGGGVPQP